jgi:hypothetical protein
MWIFLDIDGVLVPESKFDKPVSKEDYLKFDPTCLAEFETVLRLFVEARVVITSSWRELFPFEIIRPLFSSDIAPRVVGVTPFLEPKMVHQFNFLRHQEVLEYLRQNQVTDANWVAVDDIPEHYPPGTSVIATDAYFGFNQDSARQLMEYLTVFQAHH